MKFLNNISIRIKVILPIVVLTIVILMSSIFGMVNAKGLLNAGYEISDNCSKSIELLMQMSAGLQMLENGVNNHCNADNTITKNEYKGTIDATLEKMNGYFTEFAALPATEKEQEYYGAMKQKFEDYKSCMKLVLDSTLR